MANIWVVRDSVSGMGAGGTELRAGFVFLIVSGRSGRMRVEGPWKGSDGDGDDERELDFGGTASSEIK